MIRLLRHLAVCLLFLLASGLFFAPPHRWPELTYFGYGQDPLAFIWFLNWWPFALAHHLPLLFTRYADAPAGVDLVWKTSVPALGLLAGPFTAKFGAAAVYNVLMVCAPALAGFGVYLAAFELTGNLAAAVLAGVMFAGSGYEIGQAQGHLNLAFTAAVPLCLWACLAAARSHWPAWALGLVLGALLSFAFGVSQELFASLVLMAAFLLPALALLHPARRPALARLLPGIGLGLGLCLCVIAPFVAGMLHWYAREQANLSSPDMYANDLLAFIVPTPLTALGGMAAVPLTRLFTGNYTEQGAYFGLPLVLLLGAIVARGCSPAMRVAAGMAGLAAVFSLGPYLHVLGARVSTAPWILFYRLPFLSAMLPGRLVMYAWLAAAMLVALWLAAPGSSWRRYVLTLLCLGAIAPSQGFDRHWTHLQVPRVFATLPAGARVLVLPEFGQEMGWQYAAGMRFSLAGQGYLGTGQPAPFKNWRLFQPLWQNRFTAIDPREFAAYLAAYGVQYVVLLPQGYGFYDGRANDEQAAVAAGVLLRGAGWGVTAAAPDALLFAPQGPEPGAAQIAAFQTPPPPAWAVAHRAKRLRRERRQVCGIRALARFTGLDAAPLLTFYAAHLSPPLPVDAIACARP